jgi:hypothetical protein
MPIAGTQRESVHLDRRGPQRDQRRPSQLPGASPLAEIELPEPGARGIARDVAIEAECQPDVVVDHQVAP